MDAAAPITRDRKGAGEPVDLIVNDVTASGAGRLRPRTGVKPPDSSGEPGYGVM